MMPIALAVVLGLQLLVGGAVIQKKVNGEASDIPIFICDETGTVGGDLRDCHRAPKKPMAAPSNFYGPWTPQK